MTDTELTAAYNAQEAADVAREDAFVKAEIKRQARYEAVQLMLDNPHLHFMPALPGFYEVAEQLAMYLAHGSMPKPEQEPA